MAFKTGQQVCLWNIRHEDNKIIVVQEVIVKIMQTKIGPFGSVKNYQSLRAMTEGDNAYYYDKNWTYYPGMEVKLHERHYWSERSDGPDETKWVPKEAVSVYNLAPKDRVKIVDLSGREIKPKEATYCKEHDRYSFIGEKCVYCPIDAKTKTEQSEKV